MNKKIEKIKLHLKENEEIYIGIGIGVTITVVAGITCVIMKKHYSNCNIGRGIPVTAKDVPDVPELTSINMQEVNRGGLVLGDSYALNNVSFISSNRQGVYKLKKKNVLERRVSCLL